MRLAGKSMIVTGASGIAAAVARRGAAEGARVHIVSRYEPECRELVAEISARGGKASWGVADLTVETETRLAFGAALDELGGCDGLVAVAGGSGRRHGDGRAHEMSLQAWEKTLAINLSPMFLTTSIVVDSMRDRGGSIVVVSSVLATKPSPDLFATHAYATAKGAANAYVTAIAAFYAPDLVRVNAIAPGLVRTPMSERAASDPATVAYARRKQPLSNGFLDPEDVAGAAVFLLSDDSSRITGQVIAVDGGWSVTEA